MRSIPEHQAVLARGGALEPLLIRGALVLTFVGILAVGALAAGDFTAVASRDSRIPATAPLRQFIEAENQSWAEGLAPGARSWLTDLQRMVGKENARRITRRVQNWMAVEEIDPARLDRITHTVLGKMERY